MEVRDRVEVGAGNENRLGLTRSLVLMSMLIITILLWSSQINNHKTDGASNLLFVSAQNSLFADSFSGPQVVEVVISDPDIKKTSEPQAEPDVRINGNKLRMAQALDGNWYAYFAKTIFAQQADSTVGSPGKELDFGVFCSSATGKNVLGVSYSETSGVAIPGDNGITGSTNGLKNFSDCTGSPTTPKPVQNHVVRKPKILNPGGVGVSVGQTGIDPDTWPIIQLYNFTSPGDLTPSNKVQINYYKGGVVPDSVTLTFQSFSSPSIKVSSQEFPLGGQVSGTLTDPLLNIDPTDEDSWTWNTAPGKEALFYMVFDEDGNNDANESPGLVNLGNSLKDLMFTKNGELTVNLESNGNSIAEFDTNADQPVSLLKDGSNSYTRIITFVETAKNTGEFVNVDKFGDSNLDIPANVKTSDKASITYNGVTSVFGVNAKLDKEEFQIFFKNGKRSPVPGITQSNIDEIKGKLNPDDIVHFLLQFDTINDKENISMTGINLLDYASGRTYIASSKVADLQKLLTVTGARWAGPLNIDDKIDHVLKTGNIGTWTKINDKVVLTIFFHSDVDPKKAEMIIDKLGGQRFETVSLIPSITAAFGLDKIDEIARQDSVQYVDVIMPPLSAANDNARKAANVEPLNIFPYDLKGTNVKILIYDEGRVHEHPGFQGRIPFHDNSRENNPHATMVAGIIGGDGALSHGHKYAGMAPAVKIYSYGQPVKGDFYRYTSDLEQDLISAVSEQQIPLRPDLASMSLAHNVYEIYAKDPRPVVVCPYLGDYKGAAMIIDKIVNTRSLIFFEAVGNERQLVTEFPCNIVDRDGDNIVDNYVEDGRNTFKTISSPATAKNSIAVGAMNSDGSLARVSSFGPTDDGRIKPDIVVAGCRDDQHGPTTTDVNDGYSNRGCYTSFTTPVAAGATALLIEEWKKTHGSAAKLLPDTAKAILIHTAQDLGNKGPDYKYGWGALDARSAVDLVIKDKTEKQMIWNKQISNGQTLPTIFNSDGSADVKATLVWDDPFAPQPFTPILQNDLDLKLTAPNGMTFYSPLVLDPRDPDKIAFQDTDHVNNVEMAIGNKQSGNWKAEVTGTNIVQGTQKYALILSETASSNSPSSQIHFTSTPVLTARVGQDYRYDVKTTHHIGQILMFSLDMAPTGMTINSSTGVITWTPTQEGSQNVIVKVTSGGSSAIQSFIITVAKPGCLIATAAYGSEMAPQVQQLRETRDNIVMKTQYGAAFMTSFNSVYYTFAPTVAGWEQQNPAFKEIVKISITPLLSILSILNYVDIDSELKMLTYGIGIIVLNIGIYFVAPTFVVIRLKNYIQEKKNEN